MAVISISRRIWQNPLRWNKEGGEKGNDEIYLCDRRRCFGTWKGNHCSVTWTSASTVQVIPHITDEIKEFVYQVGRKTNADVVITEIGGTIGDIESQPFLEAVRQISLEVGRENSLFIHVTLVPFLSGSEEHKSKPTQHSVKELQSMGIHPNVIVLRCDRPLEDSIFRKIAMFCNVPRDCVIENCTIPCLYEVPLMLEKSDFSGVVCRERISRIFRNGRRW